ncbi:MAG: hypothetical protein COV29_03600 [Candidatus Yanofskybacteria bacterium CG10_big_fil_rev_8_21_14_0_10_36_16]|uniref:Galactose-1-phosphate uridyl transferase N-terminal domain-containing protein n=1 Tax=Candidatus Yanofskybacteria bacterium CG10_big_fil_rev_8_21_14_0_10_36_16 TaxID=1975096 RepID=A0A2J0Q750_9BACT|nr:MAG: hypothetical protein COV29_03600 [Candidatus Yanofskybacteria bacterium CG10_big_fil_rev_8_21_14_0_10_36_16]
MNEFRQDMISGLWVLFATNRARRPGDPIVCEALDKSKDVCPFEDLEISGNKVEKTYLNKSGDDWLVKVISNKYPAVDRSKTTREPKQIKADFFNVVEAGGYHEVFVFRNHDKVLADYNSDEMAEVFGVYRDRFHHVVDNTSSKYILVFTNYGIKAGGTLFHPHSQIISTSVIPLSAQNSLRDAEDYFVKNSQKPYDKMIEWEISEAKRIIYENEDFVAFCPFVSRVPYEIRIFPKDSTSHFWKTDDSKLPDLGRAVSTVLGKMSKALKYPDYNFFIHSAPVYDKSDKFDDYYTWHIEIMPKVEFVGGFEIGSGVYINAIDPDEAAKLFRETEI